MAAIVNAPRTTQFPNPRLALDLLWDIDPQPTVDRGKLGRRSLAKDHAKRMVLADRERDIDRSSAEPPGEQTRGVLADRGGQLGHGTRPGNAARVVHGWLISAARLTTGPGRILPGG